LWARIASFTHDLPAIVRRREDATAAQPENPQHAWCRTIGL
jgi:hypothetical protein